MLEKDIEKTYPPVLSASMFKNEVVDKDSGKQIDHRGKIVSIRSWCVPKFLVHATVYPLSCTRTSISAGCHIQFHIFAT